MGAIRQGVFKRCRYCGGKLDATTVRAASPVRDGILAVIFRRTIPVLLCKVCDVAPPPSHQKLYAPPLR